MEDWGWTCRWRLLTITAVFEAFFFDGSYILNWVEYNSWGCVWTASSSNVINYNNTKKNTGLLFLVLELWTPSKTSWDRQFGLYEIVDDCLDDSNWTGWEPWLDQTNQVTGWWFSHPSEKIIWVIWDDEIPNVWENKKWQPNHQPGKNLETLKFQKWSDVSLLSSMCGAFTSPQKFDLSSRATGLQWTYWVQRKFKVSDLKISQR